MSKMGDSKLIKEVKAALVGEGFLIQECDNGFDIYSVNTPYGKLFVNPRDGNIFTRFEEHANIPNNIRRLMGVGMTGKWNFIGKDSVRSFHCLFRQFITSAAAWTGSFDDK